MKKYLVFFLILLFAASSVYSQTANPGRYPRWDRMLDYIKNGTMTLSYKTLDLAGSLTLSNDEVLANSTDGDVSITFNDDAATLGQLFITSSIDSPNVADNDLYEIVFRANDDSSGLTDWVTLVSKILDASDESEDSEFSILTFLAGTEYTSVKWAGNVMTQYADAAAYYTVTQANGGGVTFDGTSDGTASFTFSDALLTGSAGSGVDVTLYSGTSGDQFLWDASEECLVLTGTDNQDALQVADGDLSVTDDAMLGTVNFLADTSSVDDSYGGTLDPAIAAYKNGQFIIMITGQANTGASTLALNGLAAKDIKTVSGADPANNDIVAAGVSFLVYRSSVDDFILLNPATTCD